MFPWNRTCYSKFYTSHNSMYMMYMYILFPCTNVHMYTRCTCIHDVHPCLHVHMYILFTCTWHTYIFCCNTFLHTSTSFKYVETFYIIMVERVSWSDIQNCFSLYIVSDIQNCFPLYIVSDMQNCFPLYIVLSATKQCFVNLNEVVFCKIRISLFDNVKG